MAIGDNYIFATGDSAAPRLRLLEKIYGGTTNTLLLESGLRQGMTVAEIGCGTGFTACHIARIVSPTGRVFAIDFSGEQLKLAKANANHEQLGNIEFVEAGATSIGLPSESVDFVFCRLVLSHIRQAREALDEFKRVLKDGGTIACEDLVASKVYSAPETEIYTRLREMANQFAAKQGVDYSIGERLPQMVREAGFTVGAVRRIQPAYFIGEEKRWWEYSIREASHMMLKAGFLNAEQIDGLLAAMEAVSLNQEVMVALPVMTQVRARK